MLCCIIGASDAFGQSKDKPPPAPASKAEKKAKPLEIAIFQLEANGVEKSVASVVTDALHAELRKLPNSKIISAKEIDAMLGFEEKKQLAGCSDTSCMVAIGGALGVQNLIIGSVGKLGSSYLMNVKLLNIAQGRTDGLFDKRLSEGDEEDFLEAIPEALATLFPQHALLWPKDSMKRKVSRAGPWPWVLVGVGGAAAVTGGVMNYLANAQYDDWKKMRYDDPKLSSTKDAVRTKEISAYALYGVGAAAIAGGLIWYFTTDYQIAKKKQEREKPDEKPAPKKAEVEFEPLFIGTYGGSVSVTW